MIETGPPTFKEFSPVMSHTKFSYSDPFLMNVSENEFRDSNVTYANKTITVNCCTNVLQLL